MILLDTDHLSVLERGGAASLLLQGRLADADTTEIATTVVTYEEQMRGWLALVARAATTEKLVSAYARLSAHIETFRGIPTLPFDRSAAREFDRLRRRHPRLGSMDLRIASIALAHGATLLSRNLTDFRGIPELSVEDWSA